MKQVLRNTDASEGGDNSVDPILMNDQTGTSTAMPLLPPDEYRLQVVKVEQARNSKNTGNVIKIQLKTLDDVVAVSGEPIKAGFPLFHNISITPTPDYPQSSINRALKQFMSAAGVDTGAFYPLKRYEGMTVKAKLKVQPATDEWDEANRVSRFVA